MSYGVLFKICSTVAIVFLWLGIVSPVARERVWKICYAISLAAVAVAAIATLWMEH